jgi:ribonuclease T2
MVATVFRSAAFAVFFLAVALSAAPAQDRRQSQPGQFDFYVLALSWSPTFCEATTERGRQSRDQCGARPFSFVVHGLWPQYDNGFPEYCQREAPFLENPLINSMLDLMPARGLVIHEWKKHGTCAGLAPRAYFEQIRKARATIKIPEKYLELSAPLMVTPDEVEEAFVEANPGLSRTGIAVTCDNRRLQEVRICMGKDLGFRECAEIDRRSCRREKLVMPPVRGGA